MFYEKKYPLTQQPGQQLILSWERGYKNTRLFHHERELVHIDSINKLKKGVRFSDKEFGEIELKFSEKPISVDIIVDGFHSPVNASHPAKKIKSISKFFYLFAVFCLINLSLGSATGSLTIGISVQSLVLAALYVICAIFSNQSKGWAVYAGFILFCLMTFLYVLILILSQTSLFIQSGLSGITLFMILGFRTVFIVFMVPYLKMASQLSRYQKINPQNSGLLDENLAI